MENVNKPSIVSPGQFLNALMSIQKDPNFCAQIAQVIFPLIYEMSDRKARKLIKEKITKVSDESDERMQKVIKVHLEKGRNDLAHDALKVEGKGSRGKSKYSKSLKDLATEKLKAESEYEKKGKNVFSLKKHEVLSKKDNNASKLFLKKSSKETFPLLLKSMAIKYSKAKSRHERENILNKIISTVIENQIDEKNYLNKVKKKFIKGLENNNVTFQNVEEKALVLKTYVNPLTYFPTYFSNQKKKKKKQKSRKKFDKELDKNDLNF